MSNHDQVRDRRAQAVEYLGGACVRCGRKDRLTFDHVSPDDKPLRPDGRKNQDHLKRLLRRTWENVVPELGIFQLLCEPCHVKKTKREHVELRDRMLLDRWLSNRAGLR